MTPVEKSILHTLAYFEQFARALTAYEIHQLLWNLSVFDSAVPSGLRKLEIQNRIISRGDLWGLSDSSIESTLRRQELVQHRRAQTLLIVQIIQKISGIRSVILMNSTAMQTCAKGSDIDLLIIARPGSLYSSRAVALAHLKWRGLAKKRGDEAGKACLGYWLSSDNLAVQKYQTEVHTAAYWIATMVPLYGIKEYRAFIEANAWVQSYLPNWKPHELAHLPEHSTEVHGNRNVALLEQVIFRLSRTKILRDPEFRHANELVCTPSMLKLHSLDKRPSYGKKMQSILDICLSKS